MSQPTKVSNEGKYPTYNGLNLPEVANRVLEKWERERVFEQSVEKREGQTPFIFFEGPPSANGLPGIHHAMGRSIKDIFCRYKTLKGFQVKRKAGWDTHGLPVELGVEKELGITKEDIGTKISVEEYNNACKEAVMRYTHIWNDLTQKMGYWVDMNDPYITYDSKYMESVWWLLGQLYDKNLMYKGYTIQPYSPKAGTGLSSHEINQPGCYRDVTDTTVVAQFKLAAGQSLPASLQSARPLSARPLSARPLSARPLSAVEAVEAVEVVEVVEIHFLAWTTTPWTLPSNTALTVGPKIEYVLAKTFNQYTFEPIHVILAKNLVGYQFKKPFVLAESAEDFATYTSASKEIPYSIVGECLGAELAGLRYEQLLPYALPMEDAEKAFVVITGDFVTTEDGTGIVHTAPTFGADDAKVAKDAGVPGLLVQDDAGNAVPLVDLQGRFRKEMGEYAGMYVKNEYYDEGTEPEKSVDVQLAIKLKTENKAFRVEKYVHSYPHCWRTDKPILYYPLDSWFIKVSENRQRLMELNDTINWKPESTGTGRFGKWLENANDWNLSRSRYWGIPIPIWTTAEGDERICISSAEQLKSECEKSVAAGIMDRNPMEAFEVGDMSTENYAKVDFHKNYMDEVVLVSSTGKPMKRESDLIDVWFDSGAMPYAQWHYPFENKALVDNHEGYPADFIAEGVDQTRGWFYTLHTISTLVFDSVAYKNVVSNGLVLDKNGIKMSKRLGNTVDPFETLTHYGADATRWYMITNAQPWDNLKFDGDGIAEVQRKFFGTLYNTYSFFALYANIDRFDAKQHTTEYKTEIDRWVLSKLNSLVKEVDEAFAAYEPTKAGRLIQEFVGDHLSNWYVRLCRKRFWVGEMTEDKIAAYQTLYTCLTTVAIIGSPIAPFFLDQLYMDLTGEGAESVHLTDFPTADAALINTELEAQMQIAQRISSMVLGLRKKENLRVRQPLQKIMVPALDDQFATNILHVKELILGEVNVKELELLGKGNDILVKSIKPNFKTIGPKYGKQMKAIAVLFTQLTAEDIASVEANGGWTGEIEGTTVVLDMNDFEITAQDIPGWTVSTDGNLTVALDVTLTDALRSEGIARELVNRVQNLRKDSGLEVTDRILLKVDTNELIRNAIAANQEYVCNEVLANDIQFGTLGSDALVTDLVDAEDAKIGLEKV